MSKKIGIVFLCIVLVCCVIPATGMAASEDPIEILIDGNPVGSPGSAILIDSTVYVPLRAVCSYYGADISWDGPTLTAKIKLDGTDISATLWSRYIIANGRVLFDEHVSVMLNNRMMLPANQVAQALNAQVVWDSAERTVSFTSGTSPIESGDTYYNQDDLYWLSRIIQAEAGGESLNGKIAVGNVVINRVESGMFPSTIYNVIFDRSCGIQFTPTANGAIYCTPSEQSIIAAKLALEGVNVAGDALFFQNTSITGSNWMSRNRDVVVTLGNHTFYA